MAWTFVAIYTSHWYITKFLILLLSSLFLHHTGKLGIWGERMILLRAYKTIVPIWEERILGRWWIMDWWSVKRMYALWRMWWAWRGDENMIGSTIICTFKEEVKFKPALQSIVKILQLLELKKVLIKKLQPISDFKWNHGSYKWDVCKWGWHHFKTGDA